MRMPAVRSMAVAWCWVLTVWQPMHAEPPAVPDAPPVSTPDSLGANQCTPPAQTVVAEVPWAQYRLAAQRVWPITNGQGVVVAVVDSGVDATVPQLVGHVRPGRDIVAGRGFANTDCVGHGTFVAGVIAAQAVPGVGFAGVAPGVTVLPMRQTANGRDGTSAGLATAIKASVDDGARVINVSTAAVHSSPDLEAAVRYAADRDVVLVAAAANEAENGNPKAYPAAYPTAVAVGAVGQDGKRADFSETGPYISVAAPGVDVLSLGAGGPGHLVGRGTSFAAPFVAGVAALVRAAHPRLTAAQVKRRLEATADHPPAEVPDVQLGWGVVNPYAAVTSVLPEESGEVAASAAPAQVAGPDWADRTDQRLTAALVVAGGAGALVLASVMAAVVISARRHAVRGQVS